MEQTLSLGEFMARYQPSSQSSWKVWEETCAKEPTNSLVEALVEELTETGCFREAVEVSEGEEYEDSEGVTQRVLPHVANGRHRVEALRRAGATNVSFKVEEASSDSFTLLEVVTVGDPWEDGTFLEDSHELLSWPFKPGVWLSEEHCYGSEGYSYHGLMGAEEGTVNPVEVCEEVSSRLSPFGVQAVGYRWRYFGAEEGEAPPVVLL